MLRGEPGHRSAGHVARSRGAVPGVTGRDTGPTGTIDARVTFAGTPDVKTIKINKDVKRCGTETTIETIRMGDDQGLAYVVVSVAGLEGPPTAGTPKLDQRGCQFRPHVVAMQPGEIEILNSDGILHNIPHVLECESID